LPVKKEAKLSASEVPGEVVGSGEEDLRCRSLLTVCQRSLRTVLITCPITSSSSDAGSQITQC